MKKSRTNLHLQSGDQHSNKQQELENRLKQLAIEKNELAFRREAVVKMRNKSLKITQKDASIEELRMLLQISHEEIEDIGYALESEMKIRQGIEENLLN